MPQGTCREPDCDSPVKARGWCEKHYGQAWRDGRVTRQVPADVRFWSKVDRHGPIPEYRPDLGACWVWLGDTNARGYGRFKVKGRTRPAHRFAHELLVGMIPDGLEPDHLCRVTGCVKVVADTSGPAHIEIVTPRENVLRSESPSGRNGRKTHCQNGHPFDVANTLILPSGRRRCRACSREKARRIYATPEGRAANLASNARYVRERMATDPEFRAKRRAYWRERYQQRKALDAKEAPP